MRKFRSRDDGKTAWGGRRGEACDRDKAWTGKKVSRSGCRRMEALLGMCRPCAAEEARGEASG
eukprot:2750274-Pleurochrysis_carterae.AAC.1